MIYLCDKSSRLKDKRSFRDIQSLATHFSNFVFSVFIKTSSKKMNHIVLTFLIKYYTASKAF